MNQMITIYRGTYSVCFFFVYVMFVYLSLCDDLVNVTPHVTTTLNDYQKLDSVSKENLWLKLGKEIYHRQVNIFFFDT